MNRTFASIGRISAAALTLSAAIVLVSAASAEQAAPSAQAAAVPVNRFSQLEFQLRSSVPDTQAFGQASGAYWGAIAETKDFPRAYSFFSALSDEAKTPNATLLASKASAAGGYVSWLYQNHYDGQAGETAMRAIMSSAVADYEQALALDPDNFSALYGYAVFEGYRPEGQAHQKELLARLDSLRSAKPYLPWAMVDRLEKTGRVD